MADTPKYLGAVWDGDGKHLSSHPGETEADAKTAAMGAFTEAQQAWEKATDKPSDPPMWDLYVRTGRATPNPTG